MPLPAVITHGQQLPAPSAETLAELAAVQPLKQAAFNAWSPGQSWYAWCSTSGTSITMNEVTWATWNSGIATTTGSLALNYATGTAYVSDGITWIAWNGSYYAASPQAAPEMTEEERAEREARTEEILALQRERHAEMEARAAAQRAEREQAEARALALLRSLLSDAQWASYQDKGWFEVTGKSGRRWRVRNAGQSGNVDLMPEIGEERDATYCAHPPERLPDADAHAAQMLSLVTDDEAFLRVANLHWRRPGTEVPQVMRLVA